jgi:hypothetical protein
MGPSFIGHQWRGVWPRSRVIPGADAGVLLRRELGDDHNSHAPPFSDREQI